MRCDDDWRATSQNSNAAAALARRALVVVVVSGMAIVTTAGSSSSRFYTAYPKYPDYCSTPAMMEERKIKPLQTEDDSRVGETRVVHVTTVIRHGARTPADGGYTCWSGYWEDAATGVWDCDLTSGMVPPTPKQESEMKGEDDNSDNDGALSNVAVVFEKHYDALNHANEGLSNWLFGTCQKGQLLVQGYDQHVMNGQFLREAYCFDESTYDHDVRMRLLDVNAKNSQPWAEPQVYLRADDEQRTLLSGEILLRSMFEPEIKKASKSSAAVPVHFSIHVADRDRDVLGVNERVCPRLSEMRENVEKSSIFKSFNNSKEATELRKFMKKDLGSDVEIDILVCLMPTICTDRPLPQAFNSSPDMVDRMLKFEFERYNIHLKANNAEFAKLAMAPVWAEIMDNINPIVNDEDHHPQTRLAVFSGHDDTISPLMASVGLWNDTAWPPYASMFLIEIHEIIDGETDRTVFKSKFVFRLIYNGQVITTEMEGCPNDSELCDIKVLTDVVSEFAYRDRHCERKKSFISSLNGGSGGGGGSFSSAFYSFLMVLLGVALGGAGTFYYLTGSLPFQRRKQFHGFDAQSSSVITERGMSIPAYSDEPGLD